MPAEEVHSLVQGLLFANQKNFVTRDYAVVMDDPSLVFDAFAVPMLDGGVQGVWSDKKSMWRSYL